MAWLVKRQRLNKKTGRKATYYSICWRDKADKVHTRAIGFCSLPEARQAKKVLAGRLAAGLKAEPRATSAGSSRARRKKIPKLREYLHNIYLPIVARDKAPKTHQTTRSAANALCAQMGDLRLDRVSYIAVDCYITTRKQMGRRSRTIILELNCLKAALKHAHACRVIPAIPPLPRIRDTDRKPHRFLSEPETVALLDALRPLDQQPHKVTRGQPPVRRDRLTYLSVLMALNTGMRRNEILSRSWDDIRWSQGPLGTLLISAKPEIGFQVKTRRSRAIPLTPELCAALRSLHRDLGSPHTGWLFPSPRNPERPRKTFIKALHRASRRANLPPIHPHGLRHTWASRLAMAGVDRRTLMELGGWKEGRMLDEIYAHVTDDHKAEVMARMGITADAARESEE